MSEDIVIQKLNTFETASDGTAVRLLVEDSEGRDVRLVLAMDCLTSLLMTLPKIASTAVSRAHNDPSLRITYPMSEFRIELSPDNLRILTLGTRGGFTVSFSLSEELSEELGYAHLDGLGQRIRRH
jgi:hypothetical protein